MVEFRSPARLNSKDGFATIQRVMVLSVPGDSLAAAAGIEPWDVIEEIDCESVEAERHLVGLDRRLREAVARDGQVELTLGRWRPTPEPDEAALSLETRQVTLTVGATAYSSQ